MEDGQADDSDDDHGALEDHEGDFLVGESTVEASLKLGDTEARPNEDGDGGGSEGCGTLVTT